MIFTICVTGVQFILHIYLLFINFILFTHLINLIQYTSRCWGNNNDNKVYNFTYFMCHFMFI